MTKQEQIDEIAKIIANTWLVDLEGDTKDVCEVLDEADIKCIARELYGKGCQIISEDSIVLTKEELVKTMESGYMYDTTRGNKINLIEMAREVERKETAKRIYEKAKKKKYINNDDEGCYWGAIALDDLADICGVEVEE